MSMKSLILGGGVGVAVWVSSTVSASLISGFESGTEGFATYSGSATFTTGAVGVTEGVSALQIQTGGGFVGQQSFAGLWKAPIIAGVGAGEQLQVDVTLNAVTPGDDLIFAQFAVGANSGGGAGGNSFQTLPTQNVPINGTTTTLTFNLADLTTVGADETFLGLILTVNSAGGVPAVWSVDNVRVVPEPASLALMSVGGLAMLRRRARDC